MVPAAIVLALAGLAAFLWALRSGQFEDPKGDATRILRETDKPE
jgi:cbb3-type cytochrome oxidase maturation protein